MHYFYQDPDVSRLFTLYGSMTPPTGSMQEEDDSLVYYADGYRFATRVHAHPSGVFIREDTLKNTSTQPLEITSALSKFTMYSGEYLVYTQYTHWVGESQGLWEPLHTSISGSPDDVRSNTGCAPFVAMWNQQNCRGMAFHILSDSTWKFQVKRLYNKETVLELGISDRDFRYVLQPGETLQLPRILYYTFRDRRDMDAYKLHRYCNDVYPAKKLPVIYDTWLYNFDTINFDLLSQQLEVAKELGIEYFVIDAGWFGKAYDWFQLVGDWEECTDCAMQGRMAEFAQKVRDNGLKFGLWFEIERAGEQSKAPLSHPEHYLQEGDHYYVNFSQEETCQYIFDILSRSIEKYGIEFIKFDFNAPLTFDPNRHSFLEYFAGYRRFIRRIKETYPEIYLENCAAGGARMSLSTIPDFDGFWMSDDHSPYRQIDVFKNTMLRMPSRMLETWLAITSLPSIVPRDPREGILSAGTSNWSFTEGVSEGTIAVATAGGPIGFTCDLTKFSPELKETAKKLIANHKADRAFWMHSECRLLADTESLVVFQFNDADFDTIRIYLSAKYPMQSAIRIFPVCLPGATYQLSDGTRLTAEQLDEEGVEMSVWNRRTANFLTLKKI